MRAQEAEGSNLRSRASDFRVSACSAPPDEMDDLFEEAAAGAEVFMDDGTNDGESAEISQEDAWVVINSFFEIRGLVRQQLDSFNQFILNSIQEMVDDSGHIVVTPENQYVPGKEAEMVRAGLPFCKHLSRGIFFHPPSPGPSLCFEVLCV